MEFTPQYQLDSLSDGLTRRYFILDRESDSLHVAASGWLTSLRDAGRSPHTIRSYGSRVAWYLSWTAQTADWRTVGLSHLVMWKRTVATTPVRKTNGREVLRSEVTVGAWVAAVRSFYEWADLGGLVVTDVAARMTELRYFAPGSPGGGEHGRRRRVLIDELQVDRRHIENRPPEWIDDERARERLELLVMNARDRFLVDLLYFTGIRVGEALSLFTRDMHLGGGGPSVGCRTVDPHFHVVLDNPVENGAEAKGCERTLYASEHLIDRYIEYALERRRLLGDDDVSPHVFVNLYTSGARQGQAMRYSRVKKVMTRVGKRIDFDLTGPHVLRHTLATRLIRGIDCKPQSAIAVGDVLGHRSAASTRVYTHDTERAKRDALTAIAPRAIVL